MVEVVSPRFQCLDDVAHDEGGRVANLVIGIFQSRLGRSGIARRQHFDVVSRQFEKRYQHGCDVLRHEGGDDFSTAVALVEYLGRAECFGRDGAIVLSQALDQRAYPQFQGAYVVHVVDFQQGEWLAVAVQDVADFVEQERVGAAAEGGHLHEVNIVTLSGHPFGGLQDAVHVGPLFDEVGVVGIDSVISPHDVVGDDIHPQVGNHLGEFVLYERVGVVGAPGQ